MSPGAPAIYCHACGTRPPDDWSFCPSFGRPKPQHLEQAKTEASLAQPVQDMQGTPGRDGHTGHVAPADTSDRTTRLTAINTIFAIAVVSASSGLLAGIGAITSGAIVNSAWNRFTERNLSVYSKAKAEAAQTFASANEYFDIAAGAVLALMAFTLFFLVIGLLQAYTFIERRGATELRWGKAWAIGGWFIPLANLFIPFAVIAEALRATSVRSIPIGSSHKAQPGRLLTAILGLTSIVFLIIVRMAQPFGLQGATGNPAEVLNARLALGVGSVAFFASVAAVLIKLRSNIARSSRPPMNESSLIASSLAPTPRLR